MTKKTRLHARAAQKNTQHVSTHKHSTTPAKIGVAASVAIASTLAMAQVAQAKTAKSEHPELVQAQAQKTNAVTSVMAAPSAVRSPMPAAAGTPMSTTPTPAPTSGTSAEPIPASTSGTTAASASGTSEREAPTPQQPTPAPEPAPASTPAQNQQNQQKQKNQVIKPNTNNPTAKTPKEAKKQVEREPDNKKTYTFTVSYCVEGYHQKQLFQPTEFTFTNDELTKISDTDGKGLYIPVKETKGYKAQRGNYIKVGDKYVSDTKKDASVQSYIKIDRTLVEANENKITSTKTNRIAHYVIEYRPKTITYYVRHMLQDPKNPDKFTEYTHVSDIIDLNNDKIHVSKTKGVVGQSLYAQPITIEGYSPEPNLVNSPIPDDDDYVDADADNPSSTNSKKKHLVLELRYLLNKHEVSYDTQGGTAIQSKTFYYGMKVDAVPTPLRKGYDFVGWTRETPNKTATDVNSSTPNKDANATLLEKMPDSNVKFVAHWKPKKRNSGVSH